MPSEAFGQGHTIYQLHQPSEAQALNARSLVLPVYLSTSSPSRVQELGKLMLAGG